MVRHRISSNCNVVFWCVRIPIRKIEEERMKKFLIFALCSVATTVLIHLIFKFFEFSESFTVENILPLLFFYFCFYGTNIPFSKTKDKE